MSSANSSAIHPSLKLIFPRENIIHQKDVDYVYNAHINTENAGCFYSYSIRRNLADLTLHTHRIFFSMNHKTKALPLSTLRDFFYVLKLIADESLMANKARK